MEAIFETVRLATSLTTQVAGKDVNATLFGSDGALGIAPIGEDNAGADGKSQNPVRLLVNAFGFIYNGTTWDRIRSNQAVAILASAARTAETASPDQTNYNHRGEVVIVNVSVITSTAQITPTIQIKDPTSLGYLTIWTAAAAIATTTGRRAYLFDPGVGTTAASYTESKALRVPRTWRVVVNVANTSSATYSVTGIGLV